MSASMSFYADADSHVRLHRYTERVPILTLNGRDHSLTISAFDRTPMADHLAFAKALATAAANYLTALETYAAALPAADSDRG
ncbi:hypothetical protein [Actinacidiphila oryziradicis]|uniref:hypothetical protein n=1 Tax=Actinacidiphila oryziradicis TaxID=2571141 RepID=UPI0023F3A800|nr:hypothetical protein [Actinacidiphila oryziradicis]MCW2871284.1 hypothetical protein [Actinacidiphila oryziradicis]